MDSTRFLRTGVALIIVFTFFSVKSTAQDRITFTWQAEESCEVRLGIGTTTDKEFTVNWGDGAIENITGTSINIVILLSHSYTETGVYTVTITASDMDCRFDYFNCGNNITDLDLTGCSGLQILICSHIQLTHLDLSGCPKLAKLECHNNDQLTHLNLSGCPELWLIKCFDNPQLTHLDLSGCSNLQELYCADNQLTHLDLSGCPKLWILDCRNNQLLTHFRCVNNQLTHLNLSGCSNLKDIWCAGNQLTHLNLSGCSELVWLWCADNQLTHLDLSGCSMLVYLYCSINQLTNIDLTDCLKLEILNCSENQLTRLDLTGCSMLVYLYCYNNQLTELGLSGCQKLQLLDCYDNQLTELDLSGHPDFLSLSCYNNQLTHLDLTGCSKFYYLDCSGNQLTNLDLTGCMEPYISYLECFNNRLQLSDLFAAHLLINMVIFKSLGTQNLQPKIVTIGEELFSGQSVFAGIFTKYVVTQNGAPTPEGDYTVVDGKLTFNTVGVYNVTMTNDAIVSSSDYPAQVVVEITVENGTSIVEPERLTSLLVYPNPTNGELKVESGELRVKNIEIFDAMGKSVFNQQLSTFNSQLSINISHLPAGIYFLHVDGQTVKFVKK